MAPITLRDYLQETEDAISAGRVDDAFTHCQNVLAQFPQSLEAQRLLGEAYLAQGRLEEAQQSFDWVLTNDPENVVAYCDRALISEGASDYDTALDCYQQAYELSRGNSQIRQEFNRLSAQAGQQGFMFSRAGLARLYMRGDLLTQAIQEWEAVLAGSPDRLDACTGLMETCWREGLYDRVEQLANQVLQDVPTCLKALLLLAHVASAKNMQQAQELLKRAEALDPDLLMAQELFSDLMAKQPAEPFLYLLKKAPARLDASAPPQSAQPVIQEAVSQPAYVPESPLPSEALATWNAHTNWNDDATLVNAFQERSLEQEGAPLPMWPADDASSNDAWSGLVGSQTAQPQQALPDFLNQLGDEAKNTNPWSMQQDQPAPSVQIPSSSFVPQEESPSEAQLSEPELSTHEEANSLFTQPEDTSFSDSLKEPPFNGTDEWENTQPPVGASGIWTSSTRTDVPPAWLNMLTQNEKRQLSDEIPAPPPVEPPVEITQQLMQKEAPKNISLPEADDNEPFSFSPEWLKSLGAAPMDLPIANFSPNPVSMPEEEKPAAPPSYELPQVETTQEEPQVVSSYETWKEPVLEPQGMPSYDPWKEPETEVQDVSERNLLATLEGLESDLRSQGFVPLEPNSLSVIAQRQEPIAPALSPLPEPVSHEDAYQTFPAALAELGEYDQSPAPADVMPASPVTPPSVLAEEPAWLTSLSTSGMGTASSSELPLQEIAQTEAMTSPWKVKSTPLYNSEEEPVREDAFASSLANGVPSALAQPQETTSAHSFGSVARVGAGSSSWQSPVGDSNAFLNSELETTMKRPAVRLQPMPQQRPVQQKEITSSGSRSRASEQTPARNASGGGLNVQERLLKGYQHQLVGDYDEAMQEYRIVIRSSPELLAEVVSNVRALLKIAPKYSAGYRILGDAYMRQGEYLQAMEAYNKALTMAKKAKG